MLCCHSLKVSFVRDFFLGNQVSTVRRPADLSCHFFFAFFVKVMDYLGMEEIPAKHVMKRWSARDIFSEHLQGTGTTMPHQGLSRTDIRQFLGRHWNWCN